jgi:hypothetical protein
MHIDIELNIAFTRYCSNEMSPDKIQLKHRLNISQQNLYIIHVLSGNEGMYLFNIRFLPSDLLLITCQEIH